MLKEDIEKRQHYLAWGVLLAVLALHLALAVVWCERHFIYFFYNSQVFMNAVAQAQHAIVNGQAGLFDLSVFSRYSWWGVGPYWPALAPMIGLWSLFLWPAKWFFLVNFLYLAVIMLSIYGATRIIIGNRFYSVLAAASFSCYWFVVVQLMAFDIQLASAACIASAFYWYFRSRFFSAPWPSMMVGVSFVLALYCDHLNPALFILPLFVVPENFRSRGSLVTTALVLALVGLCIWPHYSAMLGGLFRDQETINFLFSQGEERVPPLEAYKIIASNPTFLFSHMFYYVIAFPEKILGWGSSGLLLVAGFFVHRLKKPEVRVLWLLAIIPLVVATLIVKKNYAYIFPLCVCFAIITAVGISQIQARFLRALLIGVMVVVTCLQYGIIFGFPAEIHRPRFLFSQQYSFMRQANVPKMLFQVDEGAGNRRHMQSLRVVGQLAPLVQMMATNDKVDAVLVDFNEYPKQHIVSFLLSFMLPKDNIINVPFSSVMDKRMEASEDIYLVTNMHKYKGQHPVKSFDGGSWKEGELVYFSSKTQLSVYRLQR